MSYLFDIIWEAVDEMREIGRGDDVYVYLSNNDYKELRKKGVMSRIHDYRVPDEMSPKHLFSPPMGSMDYTSAEVSIFSRNVNIVQTPKMNRGEIIFLDRSGLREYDIKGKSVILLEDPACIEKLRTLRSHGVHVPCNNCGESGEVVVEGDDDDYYCSLSCLNEVYAE